MIAVNIETPTRLLKLFLPDMVQRGSGLPAYQRPFVSMTAMFPKKTMLNYVYGLQIADGAKRK